MGGRELDTVYADKNTDKHKHKLFAPESPLHSQDWAAAATTAAAGMTSVENMQGVALILNLKYF